MARLSVEPPALPPDLTLEEMMTLEERVARWPEQWKQRGIEQGLAQQRELLRDQAEARFGTRTAERLSASLQREEDPQRLKAIGLAVVRCETGDELLREVGQAISRITTNPAQCGGRPCVRGMRIRVTDVLDLLGEGLSPSEILDELPDLEAEDVRACVQFARRRVDHAVLG